MYEMMAQTNGGFCFDFWSRQFFYPRLKIVSFLSLVLVRSQNFSATINNGKSWVLYSFSLYIFIVRIKATKGKSHSNNWT
jgi:hypothetical protein